MTTSKKRGLLCCTKLYFNGKGIYKVFLFIWYKLKYNGAIPVLSSLVIAISTGALYLQDGSFKDQPDKQLLRSEN